MQNRYWHWRIRRANCPPASRMGAPEWKVRLRIIAPSIAALMVQARDTAVVSSIPLARSLSAKASRSSVYATWQAWLMRSAAPMVLVAIPVIFQPELRRALERVGRSAPLLMRRGDTSQGQTLIAEIVKSIEWLAQRRYGALLVFEGVTGLAEIVDSGIIIKAISPANGPAETITYARIGGRGAAKAKRVEPKP